jgi:hypothetical protein
MSDREAQIFETEEEANDALDHAEDQGVITDGYTAEICEV